MEISKDDLEFHKKLQTAIFLKSYAQSGEWKKESNFPEVAFIGRSNSGKSTLINSILGRKSLAKTSRTPGKTKLINIFAIPNLFCLVDLPGFGYSKASHKEHIGMMKLLEDYLNESLELKCIFILLDARREIPEDELRLIQTAINRNIPFTLLRTKSDKLNQKERNQSTHITKQITDEYLYVSSLTGEGIEDVRTKLRLSIQQASQ